MSACQREAIVLKYELLGGPLESEWGRHGGTLRQIADFLEMPELCDYRPIRETLQRHLKGEDIWYTKGGQGRKPALLHGQMCITADCLPRGTGQEQAALIPQRVAREQGRAQLSLWSGAVAVRGRVFRRGPHTSSCSACRVDNIVV